MRFRIDSRQVLKCVPSHGIFFLLGLLSGCTIEETNNPTTKAFYHWKTNLQLDSTQQNYLGTLDIEKLYVKFFDVDWEASQGDLIPVAKVQIDSMALNGVEEVVPCIFITNRSFQQGSPPSLQQLPSQVANLIDGLLSYLPARIKVQEIQIDCDWSGSTQEAYFSFLQQFKILFAAKGVRLSTTIRLHQWADPNGTGVPPVDRGMLMFYNNGNLMSWEENNSILNLPAAFPYLAKADNQYPLPLDWALPAFSWGVVFRDGELVHLINDLLPANTQDTLSYEQIRANVFRLKENSYLGGYYLYKDDLIRLETVDLVQLAEAKQMLLEKLPKKISTFAVYHIDAALLNQFTDEDLEILFDHP
ncbi:MAG: hypothetical protein AAF242_15140 [Bacteroidota bacterium]